jgi:hypothetical protein
LKRTYEAAEEKTDDDRRTLPLQGKTVIIEKKGDSYHFHTERGEKLSEKDASILDVEFNKGVTFDYNQVFLPTKPVRVHEPWTLDAHAFLQDVGKGNTLEFDESKGKATATLRKAYKVNARQFGVIAVHLEFPIKSMKLEGGTLRCADSARFLADATLDMCIDGSRSDAKVNVTMHMEGLAEMERAGTNLKLSFTTDTEQKGSAKQIEPR